MMMGMNAMESLKDPNMVYLDISAGISGFILTMMLMNGYRSATYPPALLPLVFLVLISRLIVDFLYYNLVSKTHHFGGSNEEFMWSSLVWFAIAFLYMNTMRQPVPVPILYASSVLCMMAIARLTHWG